MHPVLFICLSTLISCGGGADKASEPNASAGADQTRLHWFIPDGMRAEPDTFDVFEWAKAGKLPNIARLMAEGTYGYSLPTFPSHTPTNFATLLTGALPEAHGVADGPMRTEGKSLKRPAIGGFHSTAKTIPPVWSILEETGRSVYLLSVPGSTPPELAFGGTTVRGRWGGWGADRPAVIFEREDPDRRKSMGRTTRLFMLGEELTRFIAPTDIEGGAFTVQMEAYGLNMVGRAVDEDQDGGPDKFSITVPGTEQPVTLAKGESSDWVPAQVQWREQTLNSNVRFRVIRLEPDGDFRVRMVVDALNRFSVEPREAAAELSEAAGPMLDFVDNFPPQLIYYDEDRDAFLDETEQSLAWHTRAADWVAGTKRPDVFIHDVYTPNQMLTSRWWMGYIDPQSTRYGDVTEEERAQRWAEIHEMYRGLDAIIGRALEHADENTVVVLSSDHGAAPLDQGVRLNNLFQQKGWLATKTDPNTGAAVVDWSNTKVVFLNMFSVYVHPDGLDGDWTRGSGPEYEALRAEVKEALLSLKDDAGKSAVGSVRTWEEASELHMPAERVGDLLVANQPGYGWVEETTDDQAVFFEPKKTGYKQAIEPGSTNAVWTPFVIKGPGIPAGKMLEEPISHIDQLPTILNAMGVEIPDAVEGKAIVFGD